MAVSSRPPCSLLPYYGIVLGYGSTVYSEPQLSAHLHSTKHFSEKLHGGILQSFSKTETRSGPVFLYRRCVSVVFF